MNQMYYLNSQHANYGYQQPHNNSEFSEYPENPLQHPSDHTSPYTPHSSHTTSTPHYGHASNNCYPMEAPLHSDYYSSTSSSGSSSHLTHSSTLYNTSHDSSGYYSGTYALSSEHVINPVEADNYLRKAHNLPSHLHVHLNSLPDPPPGVRPPQTMPALMQLAIWGSPSKRLSLNEICDAIAARFQYYRDRNEPNAPWKNTIRHTLSLKNAFRMCPRTPGQPGRGQHWEIDLSNLEGNKRERKRGSRSSRGAEEDKSEHFSATGPVPLHSAQHRGRLPVHAQPPPSFGQSGFTHQSQQTPALWDHVAVPPQFISPGPAQFRQV
ncbi:Forkhead box protein D2 [Paramarasmius palmivorus]|uniref:Forkhead box protein D2 n=1 Tax=Paramarasmius palmivorus TaxID=297713 RepID=A0AAW0DDR3_9AGAR